MCELYKHPDPVGNQRETATFVPASLDVVTTTEVETSIASDLSIPDPVDMNKAIASLIDEETSEDTQ